MEILAIGSSPRLHGNSNSLLRIALEAAEANGHHAELLYASKLKVRPCRACGKCKTGNLCAVRDDMDLIYDKLPGADALVLATPVYYYAASAWLKAIVDRTYAVLDGDYLPRISSGKRLFVITTQEEPDRADGEAIAKTLARSFKWVGMELAGSLVATEVSGPTDHLERPDLREQARRLLVEGLSRS
ncbi:MAG: flavodoxin family protein [bacterium]